MVRVIPESREVGQTAAFDEIPLTIGNVIGGDAARERRLLVRLSPAVVSVVIPA
jgi:hypothetical protein